MRLTKLEMHGFKSFVDPTVMKFDPGITSIVGPNGCGKSNVSDSIRWVLGEKSAKALRGAKMVDVVFNGTEDRKPSGLAEVTLTISNEDRKLPVDFPEVSVTRRQYRSGETEYLINKATCRLKDIQNLFADTGIGTDGYSVLEQGKMDLILSSKPGERRQVFEEAAGITRYKTQRDEAIRKLDATEDNLERVNLIVNEVRRQINSLERQAKKAEKYRTFKEELDQLESRLLVKEYRAQLDRQHQLEAVLREINQENDTLQAAQRERDGRISQLQLILTQDEEALSAASGEVHHLETQAGQVDTQLEVNRTRMTDLTSRAQRAQEEAEGLRRRAEQLRANQESERAAATDAEHKLESLAGDLRGIEQEFEAKAGERQRHQQVAQALQQEGIDLVNRRSEIRGESEAIQGKLTVMEEQAQKLRDQLAKEEQELTQTSLHVEEAARKVGGRQEEIKSLQGDLGDKYRRSQQLEEEAQSAENSASALKVALSSKQGRLKLLEELSSALEGFAAGPKALLIEGGHAGNEFSSLASLAQKVKTEPQYEAAVELSVGYRLQTLLCGSPEEARKALEWLQEKKQGRATLMPFGHDTNTRREFSEALLNTEGVLGVLADKIKADAGLEPLVEWLAGSQLLVDNLDVALSVRLLLPPYAEAVTLKGEIVSAQGMITGGALESSERGLLGRDREIGQLQEEISSLRTQISSRDAEASKLRADLTAIKSEIEAASTNLKDVQIDIAKLEKEHSAKREEHRRRTQENEDRQRAVENGDLQASKFRERARQLEESLAGIRGDENEIKEKTDAALEAIELSRKDEEMLQGQVSEKKIMQAETRQGLENHKAGMERLQREIKDVDDQVRAREQETNQAKNEGERLDTENKGLEQKLANLYNQKDEAQKRVTHAAETKTGHQAEMTAVNNESRSSGVRLTELNNQKHSRQLDIQELKLKREKVADTLMREYNLNLEGEVQEEMGLEIYNEIEDENQEPLTDEAQSERVGDLKKKLSELGVVNPAAAEEYRELEQRHSLLVGQVEDLKKARNDLTKVISKINETTRERFIETFEKVHINFQKVYRLLFGGGEAKLVLNEENEDSLESGIDIIARPPGKRQQSITLLSGGERSMTAIALLFALFLHKPSPFCVLDEIDAPLDDANISRFTKLLTEFSKNSQFIVITHSKLTMETAQALYGVTMEEAGVSTVVSAKFKKAEETNV